MLYLFWFVNRCSGISTVDPIREDFLRRLQTFDVFNWSGKPIDPPQCSKYGWEIAEKDVLKCSKCNNYLSVELSSPLQRHCYQEACKKLRSNLVSKHSKFCVFATNPICESVGDINHLTQAELLSSFSEESSVCDLQSICFKFPRLAEVVEVFDWLVEESKLDSAYKSSFILVITGWTYLKENHLAKCYYCNRKWSLEQFVSKNSGDEGNKSDGEECPSVNPISQHQSWCAWRRSILGWQVQLEQLQQMRHSQDNPKKSRLHSSDYASLSDGMRSIRKVLNGTLWILAAIVGSLSSQVRYSLFMRMIDK